MSGIGDHDRYTDEELLADLERVAEELGRGPSMREYDEHGNHHPTTLRRRFGTWMAAVEETGYEPRMQAHGGGVAGQNSLLEGVDWEDLTGGVEQE